MRHVVRRLLVGAHPRRDHEPVSGLVAKPFVGAGFTHQALAVLRDEGVDVDAMRDALRDTVGHAGDHHAAVAVPDEDDVAELLEDEQVDDVLDVGVEPHVLGDQVAALAQPGERRPVGLVTAGTEPLGDVAPGPASTPGAVHQDVGPLPRRAGRLFGNGRGSQHHRHRQHREREGSLHRSERYSMRTACRSAPTVRSGGRASSSPVPTSRGMHRGRAAAE